MASSRLRIKIRCPAISPALIELEGCSTSTTLSTFKKQVAHSLDVNDMQEDGDNLTILAGFPPRPLNLEEKDTIGSVISDNEIVVVKVSGQDTSSVNPEGGKWGRNKGRKTSSHGSAAGPSKDVKRGKGKTKASSCAGRDASAGGRANGIQTLSGALDSRPSSRLGRRAAPGSSEARQSPQARARAIVRPDGSIGRINSGEERDGAVSNMQGPPNASSRKRPRSGTKVALTSEGDIAERLLQAVGGGGKGLADRFFRKAMRLAVDKQYDQSRADARVRAAMGGWYETAASSGQRRLGDGESTALTVSFSKGDGAKSSFEETVDRIPRVQVSAVVRMIARDPESREMLKPHNFAGCSPRMFWSLVEHWGGDIPAALRSAAPDIDWSFLETRDRKPSEKAIENARVEAEERRAAEEEKAERQKQKEAKREEHERRRQRREGVLTEPLVQDEASPAPDSGMPSSAKDAVGEEDGSEVNNASARNGSDSMSSDQNTSTALEARQRAADAAAARLVAAQKVNKSEASESASKEDDRSDVDTEGLTEITSGDVSARLLIAVGIKNIQQLADCDEGYLAREICRRQAMNHGDDEIRVNATDVSEWVEAARGEELDDIMDSIFGDQDVLEAFEKVRISTPKDLIRLAAFPDVLVEAIRDCVGAETFATMETKVTEEAIKNWGVEGRRVLAARPWLELWVHE